MCPVQWGTPTSRRAPILPFVPVQRSPLVMLLGEPGTHATIKLHWLEESDGSYPCLGENCPYCPSRVSEYSYAAALWLREGEKRWVRALAPLGDPGFPVVVNDLHGRVIRLYYAKTKDGQTRISYTVPNEAALLPYPKPQKDAPFDVRPYLLRRWGLFKEADLVGCTLHTPCIEQAEGGGHAS